MHNLSIPHLAKMSQRPNLHKFCAAKISFRHSFLHFMIYLFQEAENQKRDFLQMSVFNLGHPLLSVKP